MEPFWFSNYPYHYVVIFDMDAMPPAIGQISPHLGSPSSISPLKSFVSESESTTLIPSTIVDVPAPPLTAEGPSSSQASTVAGNNTRHRLLNQLREQTREALGLTEVEVQAVPHNALSALSKYLTDLIEKGLSKEQVLTIAHGSNAAKALSTFHGFNALRAERMPLNRLAQIVHRDEHLNQGEWARQQSLSAVQEAQDDVKRRSSKRLRTRYASQSSAGASSATLTRTDMSPPAPHIPPPPPEVEGMRAWRMNSAQVAYVRDEAFTDRTAEIVDSSADLAPSADTVEVIVATGKQVHDTRLRMLFPIRDVDTIDQVAEPYASSANPYLCDPNVKVRKVIFTKAMEKKLCKLGRENIGAGKMFDNNDNFIEAIKTSCSTMLTASMRGAAAPSSGDLQIIILRKEDCDNETEANALVGTYGGRPANYAHDAQPGIWAAKLVCFFGGVKCTSPEDRDAYIAQFGTEEGARVMKDYGIHVTPYRKAKQIAFAPYGTGDAGQLINSSFKLMNNGQMIVDSDATNAFFDSVTFELTDKRGETCTETIPAVWLNEDAKKQIKVNYGKEYKMGTAEKRKRVPKGYVEVSVSPEPPNVPSGSAIQDA